MAQTFTPPGDCPVCGEPVPAGARSCPGCGADERAGWDEVAAMYDTLNLPDSAFEPDDPPAAQPARPKRDRFWPRLALLAGAVLVVFYAFRFLLPHG